MTTTRQPLELVPTPLLSELVDGYKAYLTGEKRREQGRKGYLKEELGEEHAGSTIRQALAVIRDFSCWAVECELLHADPTAKIRRPRRERPDPSPLYPEDIAVLLQAIAMPPDLRLSRRFAWERNRLVVLLFLYTGLRLAEVANLQWRHIKLSAGIIDVRQGKGGKDRIVPIHPTLRAELERIPVALRKPDMAVVQNEDGTPYSRKSVCHIFDRWLKKRLQEVTDDEAFHVYAHRLRHTFASHLVWADVDLRTVQELLGHAQLSTTEHYVAVDHRRKRSAVDRLSFGGAGQEGGQP